MSDQQAQVTLTALNPPSIVPAQRFLQLTSKERTVSIGRASKSISKGLVASIDNAWFDSPVMSRNHAEIMLHSDNKTVQIQDVGSMHGTILNDQELQPKEPRSLNNGDVVKFGAEVRRGSETFPACSFKIEYDFSALNTMGSTSKVSDNLDVDDDVIDTDDENPSIRAGSNSEGLDENTSSDTPVSKRSISLEIVEEFSGPKGLTEGQALEDMMNMRKPSQTVGNAENPLVVDSDDDDGTDDQEADEEMSDNSDNRSDSEDSNLNNPASPLLSDSESEAEESSEVIIEEVRRLSDNNGIKISNIRSTRDIELWGPPSDAEDVSDSDSESENEAVPNKAVNRSSVIILSDAEDSEDSDSVDNDSIDSVMGDGGISYQASEPESEAAEDSLASPSSDDGSDDIAVTTNSDEISKYEIMKKALASDTEQESSSKTTPTLPSWVPPFHNNEPLNFPEIGTSAPPFTSYETGKSVAQPSQSRETAESMFSERDPSPSYAAMAKEDNLSITARNVPPPFEPTREAAANASTVRHRFEPLDFVQIMGEKTGKTTYFQAREMNKAQVAASANQIPSQGSGSISMGRPTWPQSVTNPSPFRHPGFTRPTLPPFKTIVDRHDQLQQSLDRSVQRVQEQAERAQEVRAQVEAQRARVNAQAAANNEGEITRLRNTLTQMREKRMMRERTLEQDARTAAFKSRILSLHNERHNEALQSAATNLPKLAKLPSYSEILDYRDNAFNDGYTTSNTERPVENNESSLANVWIDPVETSTQQVLPGSESKKRKADDISELTESEVMVRTEESTVPQIPSEESVSTPNASLQSSEGAVAAPTLVQDEQPITRAPKRFKRFAEAVGYAALGGAAVGAGLFSVLVATAPDFL